jgi:hypothetical protein
MKKYLSHVFIYMLFVLSGVCNLFAEGKPATELNKKVKTEGLTGLNQFLATTYNNNRLLYAVISTCSIIILGLIVTYFIGLILKPKVHSKTEY